MQIRKEVTVFEFGLLAKSSKAQAYSHIEQISSAAFEYLKVMCLSESSERRLLKLRSTNGIEVLQLQNYAGVIFTPDGTQIEVLPKVGKGFDDTKDGRALARFTLIKMLRALRGYEHIQISNAHIASEKMPMLEVFITQFLQSVNQLVKRGLRSDYVWREDNLAFVKGKLSIKNQLRHNSINKHRFNCEYEEFVVDRPANRLICSALKRVSIYSRTTSNQRLARELIFAFEGVSLSPNFKKDFSALKLDRGMNYYASPLAWSRLILEGFSPQTLKGERSAISLLFPMEKVFEDYVAKVLERQLVRSGGVLTLQTQARGHFLGTYHDKGQFAIKPDLLIQREGNSHIVLDTKWKLLDKRVSNSNISQSDIYQLFAYAKKYLAKEGTGKDVVLIYPSQDNFDTALPEPFELGDGHKLWVMPFDVAENDNCLKFDSRIVLK
ncbi:McrC family protein [Rosenbergiella collisarenosi]|uniref:McrC family protein n=1 Tax=Rosenbergiella collisarenosi TaxID=1544695 RepID=UPI001F4EBA2C|nr:McrC family protein [Rosenbergiella collisarenosi]